MLHLFVNSIPAPPITWREAFPDYQQVDFARCLALARENPAAIIWLRGPSGGGEAVVRILGLLKASVTLPVVVLSDEPSDAEALACFTAGASGYCNTHAAPTVLQQVAGVVAQGGVWLGQSVLQRLMLGVAGIMAKASGEAVDPAARLAAYGLTERELDVARRVAAGASNKEIARQLEVSERTVKAHLSAVFSKLGVRDRLQLSLKINGSDPS